MIFGVADDGLAHVFDDILHVRLACEPFDVESGVFVFYAEDGTWLRAHFGRPTRRSWFGLGRVPGWFDLVPDPNLDRAVDPLELSLAECSGLEPNRHFDSLGAILEHVEARRHAR